MGSKKKDSGSTAKMVLVAGFLALVILLYFNYISNKSSEVKKQNEETEIEQLCNYNMIDDYPKTPRDVAKLHNRYFKMFYGKTLKDEELVTLNQQIRYLYSEELLSYNDENNNLIELKNNISEMKEKAYTYKLCELPEASQVEYYKQNGVEMATLEVRITLDMEDSMGYIYTQYVFVKENDKWKIQAWGESKKAPGLYEEN